MTDTSQHLYGKIEKLMPKARLIHLVTHGLLDDIKQLGVPSAIALAPSDNDNGFLTAGEILEMKLNAELIQLAVKSESWDSVHPQPIYDRAVR